MRKIISKKESAKKTKMKQVAIGILLTLVMFSSAIGYSLLSRQSEENAQENFSYKGISFTKNAGAWDVWIGNFKFSLLYTPQEAGKVYSEIHLLDAYTNKPLYISSDGLEGEIYKNLMYQNQIVQRVQYACLDGQACSSGDYPIKTCEDNFILIQESEETEIRQQDNCLFIKGEREEMNKLIDSVLYEMVGIQ